MFLLAATLIGCGGSNDPDSGTVIQISDAYVKSPIPGKTVAVGYVTLTNQGAKDCVLNELDSDFADTVELHEHRTVDGMMAMRRVDGFTLPGGATQTMAPGGYHLMFFGVDSAFASETVTISFDFTDCGAIEIQVPLHGLPN
ncbi:MAG: copper chaperone PCu(A)C [bacterium]